MTKKLLETRKQVKKRKPTYKRVQANQFAKFKNDPKWRRPKGMGNKDRRNRKGHVGMLKVGYGSPNEVKGANSQGLFEVLVHNKEELSLIDTKTQIGVIGSTVGAKKRLEILKEAEKLKMPLKGIKSYSEAIASLTKTSKKEKKEAVKKTESKKAEKETKSSKKEESKSEEAKK
jgi:large subunit ribosomal protein L32e